ncbi:50S ribosomal protein L1 [Candidatus Woesearchaeota archaeon]|jgi:large subunit ribosomal protein L1|nr:50S ribosomal protein L1 [Candidatus Woesearchaeota archaeon]MDP6648133.1 50S ribosomal protein L1 [Candidatus Woesearchaeota archaeon]|tara:strand:+ start:89272 stop:89952 length:681 start_codon:yes stop_codon:yes gene_type:complete
MNKEQIQAALAKAKDISSKRNFKQSYDLIINLKGIDKKKQEHQIDAFITLPHSRGKKLKICAIVGPELEEQAKGIYDSVILPTNFQKYKEKKDVKKVANEFNFFIAQANIMPKIATTFGRVFGPRGKMPNPKFGGVVPPNANIKPLYEKLQRTIRVNTKTAPMIQSSIGTEDMDKEEITDNALAIYDSLLHLLPNEKHNIKDVHIKLTMGKPVKVGEKLKVVKETK